MAYAGRMRFLSLPFLFFSFAIVVYALFGVPTPSHPGLIEALVAGGLLAAFLAGQGWRAFLNWREHAPWFAAGQAVLIWGLSVPLAIGIAGAHGSSEIVRDLAGFVFLIFPLLFIGAMSERRAFYFLVGFLGAVLALRTLHLEALSFLGSAEKLDYLEIMPSILFAALFFAGSGVQVFCERFSVRGVLWAGVYGGAALLCLLPLMATEQRASLGVFAVGMVVIGAAYLWRSPRRAVWIVLAGLGLAFAFAGQIGAGFSTLANKTMLVGANMRFEEFAAVWAQISDAPGSLLLGKGWGAVYASPAVAGISVNYTHSLLSALLLKGGLLGFVLGGSYVALLLWGVMRRFWAAPVVSIAIMGPILIDVFFYASYKSLDFALVMLAAALGAAARDKLPESVASA